MSWRQRRPLGPKSSPLYMFLYHSLPSLSLFLPSLYLTILLPSSLLSLLHSPFYPFFLSLSFPSSPLLFLLSLSLLPLSPPLLHSRPFLSFLSLSLPLFPNLHPLVTPLLYRYLFPSLPFLFFLSSLSLSLSPSLSTIDLHRILI